MSDTSISSPRESNLCSPIAGNDALNKFKSNIAMLGWSKTLLFDAASHMIIFNQSVCFISL